MELQLQITGTKPFGKNNEWLNFNANTPSGPIEGIVWDAENQGHFRPGTTLVVTVGEGKDPVAYDNYKGKTRLNIRKGAQIGYAAGAQPTGAYTPPAAPQPAYTPPAQHHAPPAAAGGRIGERVVQRHGELIATAYMDLKQRGLPEELCIRGAALAPSNVSLWWFGEKDA